MLYCTLTTHGKEHSTDTSSFHKWRALSVRFLSPGERWWFFFWLTLSHSADPTGHSLWDRSCKIHECCKIFSRSVSPLNSPSFPFTTAVYRLCVRLRALSYTHPPSHWKCNAILLNQPIRNARIFQARAELDNRIGQSRKIQGRAWPFHTTLPSKHWLNSIFIISYQRSESRAVSYHIYDFRNYI